MARDESATDFLHKHQRVTLVAEQCEQLVRVEILEEHLREESSECKCESVCVCVWCKLSPTNLLMAECIVAEFGDAQNQLARFLRLLNLHTQTKERNKINIFYFQVFIR